ncbi:hypothetical protein QFZ34_000355 [Phyllobacterium ifriqiyense]|uniref:Uncharacterized protein n=1 Tax=Phyllobacterium ifriqiyense TaxID=314238 RepID=A0ABU0S343_9HYPH|nr:hypothetical protein [Phyllobacterium ifriqiyense]
MIHPNSKVKLFVPDEITTSAVMSFDNVVDALEVIDFHSVWKVHVEGFGPMTPEEFKLACVNTQSS